MQAKLWPCVCALLTVGASLSAEERKISVEDYFTLGILYEAVISPDGGTIAYTEGRWQESTNDRKTEIWLVSTEGGAPRRLTHDRLGFSNLRWSPDGRELYALGAIKHEGETLPPYNDASQVWRLELDGSTPVAVSRSVEGVESFDVAADGKWLAYSESQEKPTGDWAKLQEDFSDVHYSSGQMRKTTITRVDLDTWRTTTTLEFAGAIDGLSISPDGRRIAMVTAPDSLVSTMEGRSEMTILELADGSTTDLDDALWRKQAPSPFGRVAQPKWSADSQSLAFAVGFDAYPSEVFVATWRGPQQPGIQKVPRPGKMSLHGGVDGGMTIAWKGNARELCVLGDVAGAVQIFGWDGARTAQMTSGSLVVTAFSWDPRGTRAAAIIASPDRMADIHVIEAGQLKRLTDIHAHTRQWNLPKISTVKWQGANGDAVEGILELPANFAGNAPLPLVVNLHGGPTSSWNCDMIFGFTGSVLFAGQGYAFFSPNYRGSTGYGDSFITGLVGHENEIEVDDILAGIDALVARGIADPERIAVAGWSNGGYLTNCLISKTDRFKAASSGAGIADTVTEWGTNDEPAFPVVFAGGPPWKAPDEYHRTSPIWSFERVTTPTLFHVGENDPRCPKGQSQMAHRALSLYSKTPTQLLVYPGEGHGLSKYGNRKAKMSWELAWFDHFVKSKAGPKKQ